MAKLAVLFAATAALAAIATAQSNPNSSVISDFSLSDPSLLKVQAIVDNVTNEVTFPVFSGTPLNQLVPTYSLAAGYSAWPASGTVLDLRKPVHLSIYANGTEVQSWQLSAVDMGSPALPGLYADPNIVVFDNMYYVYTTTDGFPGWVGQTFYVWSSADLVNWTRTAEPILTLNGTDGNVPWATGNAWAPTIHHRNGTYYLYFSGQNPLYNHKTIGVATAPSPTGPFTAEPTAMITNNEIIHTGQAVDPAAFVDPATGKYYLFWGNGGALYAELADDMTSLKNDTVTAISGLTNFTEASFVVYRKPYYHYTYSHGDTGLASYSVGYATAKSVHGPWTYRGVVLHERDEKGILATGSSSTVNVPGTDKWFMAYHRFRIPGGDGTHRETCIDRTRFNETTGLLGEVIPTLRGAFGDGPREP